MLSLVENRPAIQPTMKLTKVPTIFFKHSFIKTSLLTEVLFVIVSNTPENIINTAVLMAVFLKDLSRTPVTS